MLPRQQTLLVAYASACTYSTLSQVIIIIIKSLITYSPIQSYYLILHDDDDDEERQNSSSSNNNSKYSSIVNAKTYKTILKLELLNKE